MSIAMLLVGAILWGLHDNYKKGRLEKRSGDNAWTPESCGEPEEKNYSSFIGYVICFIFAAPCAIFLVLGCLQAMFGSGAEVAASSSQHLHWGSLLLIPVIITQLIFRRKS